MIPYMLIKNGRITDQKDFLHADEAKEFWSSHDGVICLVVGQQSYSQQDIMPYQKPTIYN
jgi:hypothetical protein